MRLSVQPKSGQTAGAHGADAATVGPPSAAGQSEGHSAPGASDDDGRWQDDAVAPDIVPRKAPARLRLPSSPGARAHQPPAAVLADGWDFLCPAPPTPTICHNRDAIDKSSVFQAPLADVKQLGSNSVPFYAYWLPFCVFQRMAPHLKMRTRTIA